jgi:two-component system cell cycle response regulator
MSARVLVVDDVLPNVKLLEAKLTSEYFDVLCATSGQEALDILRDHQADIVLLDVMMPGMDGFEVCRRIKADPKTMHIPVVMLTALDHPADRVAGLEAGAEDFLTKPVQDTALFARVRSLVRLKMLTDELRMREATGESFGASEGSQTIFDQEITGGRILLVEDHARMALRMSEALGLIGTTQVESTGQHIPEMARDGNFDLVIISLSMEGIDGLRICSHLRSFEETRQLPILVLADQHDSRELVRSLEIGVNDYLVRPVDRNELLARARTQIRRKRYSDHLRESMHLSYKMATTDAVTGLYNRHFMAAHLGAVMKAAERSGKPFSVMMLDIDHFKKVNDTYGHAAGDEVLREFGRRIASNIRGVDLAARYGGEEFVVIMPDTDTAYAYSIADRLRKEIEDNGFKIATQAAPIKVTVSIGLAGSEDEMESPEKIIETADGALYIAKNSGRNRVVCTSLPQP